MHDFLSANTQKKQQSQPFVQKIVKPLLLLVSANACILLVAISLLGVLRQLNQKSYDILSKQISTRQSYLQTQMTRNWMQLDDLANTINTRVNLMRRAKMLDMQQMDTSGEACSKLLIQIEESMVSQMYSMQVSGIYVVFNTHDLEAEIAAGDWHDKTGLYIRDNDPLSAASNQYSDLLLMTAPVSVVQSLALSTDANWEPRFRFSADQPYPDWFTQPYLTALHGDGNLAAHEYGIWSAKPDSSGAMSLTYSIPLILPNGTLYGILGIELLPKYLSALMPTSELESTGCYALVLSEAEPEAPLTDATVCAISGKTDAFTLQEQIHLTPNEHGGLQMTKNGNSYEIAAGQLAVYSRNAPFENQRWFIIGAVPSESLYAFSARVAVTLMATVLITLVFGIFCVHWTSYQISKPIVKLERELKAGKKAEIPTFTTTGITEIDNFAHTITDLSQNMVNASRRFLSIMEMFSIDIGGYELDTRTGAAYVTDSFFPMLGRNDVDISQMTVEKFRILMRQIYQANESEPEENGILYCIPADNNTVRYIHVEEARRNTGSIGIAEDVTTATLERKRIEHERDYDLLTGILNRRAFYSEAEQLLADKRTLGTAVLFMIDLDNLKIINDAYGHEWGDRYLIAAANCMQEYCPECSVIARVAGDEYNILMYGFPNQQDAVNAAEALQAGFRKTTLSMPDGQTLAVSASGGYVFTEESSDLKQLIRYADFAMYLVKHGRKGGFQCFDRTLYQESELHHAKQRAFKRVMNEEKIHYVFQPIVNARTGQMYACEALMRVLDKEIANTEEFLRLAKQENALNEIEHLTWNHALAAFHHLIESGAVDRKTRIFVNSQVSQILSAAEQRVLIERYSDIRENAVMEVVETDSTALSISQLRNQTQNLFAVDFALDDYGTGYNSEKNLLELMPRYVKLDMSLVRNVERHKDRQKLIQGFITFAHDKNMIVLAEGVETLGELQCLLELGVDMLQGFLLARPAEIPLPINPEAVALIQRFADYQESELPLPYYQ